MDNLPREPLKPIIGQFSLRSFLLILVLILFVAGAAWLGRSLMVPVERAPSGTVRAVPEGERP